MNCKNCDKPLAPEDKFCSICGAKYIDHRITFKYLYSEFAERFLNFENNLIARTFRNLFTNPSDVINGYINGLRKRYVNVAGYIALALTFSGFQMFVILRYFPETMQMPEMYGGSTDFMDSYMGFWTDFQSILYLILIPVYALFSKLVFLNKKNYNYAEHIVIMGYTQAQMSLTFVIPVLILTALGVSMFYYSYFMMFVMLLYTAYCYKKVFSLTMEQIVLKTLLFIGILIVVYVLAIIVLIAVMFLTHEGDGNPFETVTPATSYIISSAINCTS